MIVFEPKSPAAERDYQIYYARVMLREARARRRFHAQHARLLDWAATARGLAARIMRQPDLFASTVAETEGRSEMLPKELNAPNKNC